MAVIMFSLQNPEMIMFSRILQLQNQCLCHVHNMQPHDGCFVIHTMDERNLYSALILN